MVGQQSLDLLIGVRIPVSQPTIAVSIRWSVVRQILKPTTDNWPPTTAI